MLAMLVMLVGVEEAARQRVIPLRVTSSFIHSRLHSVKFQKGGFEKTARLQVIQTWRLRQTSPYQDYSS